MATVKNLVDPLKHFPHRCEDVYEMEDIIGEGTFSDVVRGVKDGQKYAIKIIDKTKITTEKQKWRLKNEIAIHKQCLHPNIARYIEYYESDIDVCIVMELCDGGELFNRIVEKGCFSEGEASRAIQQICCGVQHLHHKGIVHRDIKPENLLYTSKKEDSILKLADFGLAKEISEEEGRAMLKASLSGTTAYCAPERLNQSQEGKAVDMWSIGCIMYFLLFGVPPFYSEAEDEDEQEEEIFEAVKEGNAEFPPDRHISDLAASLIQRLLEKDPAKRATADEVLCHPWIKSHSLNEDHSFAKAQNSGGRAFLKSSINKIIDVHAKEEMKQY